jgi:hypothetical protein
VAARGAGKLPKRSIDPLQPAQRLAESIADLAAAVVERAGRSSLDV